MRNLLAGPGLGERFDGVGIGLRKGVSKRLKRNGLQRNDEDRWGKEIIGERFGGGPSSGGHSSDQPSVRPAPSSKSTEWKRPGSYDFEAGRKLTPRNEKSDPS